MLVKVATGVLARIFLRSACIYLRCEVWSCGGMSTTGYSGDYRPGTLPPSSCHCNSFQDHVSDLQMRCNDLTRWVSIIPVMASKARTALCWMSIHIGCVHPWYSKYNFYFKKCIKDVVCKSVTILFRPQCAKMIFYITGLILGLRPANERRRYFVTTSLIGWAQA